MKIKTEYGPGKTSLYYNNAGLFSDVFLEDTLPHIKRYYNSPSIINCLNDCWSTEGSSKLKESFQKIDNLWSKLEKNIPKFCENERQLQDKWINKIFEILGWKFELEKSVSRYGSPNSLDYVLYKRFDDYSKSKELKNLKRALAIAEAKRWETNLDGKGLSKENPSYQIIDYIKTTDKTWGILTNGHYWRIYCIRSESKHTTYYEVDLIKILETKDYERFKYFYNFFRTKAFEKRAELSDRCFLDFVYEDGKAYSQRVESNLHNRVYKVVCTICKGFLHSYEEPSEKDLEEVYEYSIYYLFKLMFVLNCESKGLLEVNKQDDYYEYSLRKKCMDIKRQYEEGKNWSSQTRIYNDINDLFHLLGKGDSRIGVYEFGNELFGIGDRDFYFEHTISDESLKHALLDLAFDYDKEKNLQFIDYKILSPDHLGSLFESLLEYKLSYADRRYVIEKDRVLEWETLPETKRKNLKGAIIEKGDLYLLGSNKDRKNTGSYYTPQHIVDYIVKESLDPLCGDTVESILSLRVCDSASGSGHFLLGVVKFLEERIQEIICRTEKNDLNINTDEIRKKVLHNCIFGADTNPLAIVLTKLSLWMYTAQKKFPLEPLNDQLFCGDSLLDERELGGFVWKEVFPEIFNNKGGFDVVVGNPPYIFSRDKKLSEEKKKALSKYESANYQINTYSLFVERGFKLLNDEGVLGFITPNNWMTIVSMDKFRKMMATKSSHLIVVNHLYKVFSGASVDTAIIIARLQGKKKMELYISSEPDDFKCIRKQPLSDFSDGQIISFSQSNSRIMDKINNYSTILKENCRIKSGLKAYETGKGNPSQTDKMKKGRIYHSNERRDKFYRKYLIGEDVCRYHIKWSGQFLKYGKNLAAPRDTSLFEGERILVRQIPAKGPCAIYGVLVDGEWLND